MALRFSRRFPKLKKCTWLSKLRKFDAFTCSGSSQYIVPESYVMDAVVDGDSSSYAEEEDPTVDDTSISFPHTRSGVLNEQTFNDKVTAVVRKLILMGIRKYLINMNLATTFHQIKAIDASLKVMARFVVWSHFNVFPERILYTKCLGDWIGSLISTYYDSLGAYCQHLEMERKFMPATVLNHLMSISKMVKWFRHVYQRDMKAAGKIKKKCRTYLFTDHMKILTRKYNLNKKRHQRLNNSMESLVKRRKRPPGHVHTQLQSTRNAVHAAIESWGTSYMTKISSKEISEGILMCYISVSR